VTPCWVCGKPSVACDRLAPLPFLECPSCGFVFRADRSADAVHATYENGAYADAEVRGQHYMDADELVARRRDARVRLRFMAPYVSSGRLLDVGAAGGAFVAEAGLAGFDASGIEATPGFAEVARETLGVDVVTGTIESARLPDASYDAITLWHVLEHIPEPVAELARLRDALVPGGVLALEVPNAGGVSALRDGVAWPSLEPDVHVNQFTPLSLVCALDNAGLHLVIDSTVPITPYLTLRAALGPRHLAGRLKSALAMRSLAAAHASGHELLRAVAVRP
jgi:SAM-dependent methyltransferase